MTAQIIVDDNHSETFTQYELRRNSTHISENKNTELHAVKTPTLEESKLEPTIDVKENQPQMPKLENISDHQISAK